MTLIGGLDLAWRAVADSETTAYLAETLLDERQIACVNNAPGIISLLTGGSERREAREAGVLLKTAAAWPEALAG